ncbi:MAG: 50S ribosomal protein L11 methyltransferase [Bacteroidota bacterium]
MAKGIIYQLMIVPLSDEQKEIVSAHLDLHGVVAIEETEAGIQLYDGSSDRVTEFYDYLCSAIPFVTRDQMTITPMPDQNWNHAWESSFDPILIDDFCTVRATFHDIEVATPHEIIIDPEMAFGTGHHETTYGMIKAMSRISFGQSTVLDYGCGTAILSLLAEQLGSTDVSAIDYDPLAIECAAKCLELNHSAHITLYTGEIESLETSNLFDIVLANINRNVLLDQVNEVAIRHRSGGTLLLSGILESDGELVRSTYEYHGYRSIHTDQHGEWLCMQFERI